VTGVWGWSGWALIMLVPFVFWAGIVVFLVILFGDAEPIEQVQEVEAERTVLEPVRDAAPLSGGLGWRPAVPSHH